MQQSTSYCLDLKTPYLSCFRSCVYLWWTEQGVVYRFCRFSFYQYIPPLYFVHILLYPPTMSRLSSSMSSYSMQTIFRQCVFMSLRNDDFCWNSYITFRLLVQWGIMRKEYQWRQGRESRAFLAYTNTVQIGNFCYKHGTWCYLLKWKIIWFEFITLCAPGHRMYTILAIL